MTLLKAYISGESTWGHTMGTSNQHGSSTETFILDVPFPAVLGVLLVTVYSIAQATSVLRSLLYTTGEPASQDAAVSAGNQAVVYAISSFGNLAGNVFAGAPTFALLTIGVAGYAVYRGRSLIDGTLLSMTLTVGVFVGVGSIFVLVESGDGLYLIASGLVLGLLYGGIGGLLGAGVKYGVP